MFSHWQPADPEAYQYYLKLKGYGTNELLILISWQLHQLFEQQKGLGKVLMLDLTALTDAVAAQTTVEGSVETLLTTLTGEITTLIANSGNTVDPAALKAIVDGITANNTKLQAAVTANTPAAPTA